MKLKKLQLSVFALVFVLNLLSDMHHIRAQQTISGPILVSRVVGGGWITFEDVGLNRTWRVTLPDSSFFPSSWSPDGCNLLLQGHGRWGILSMLNGAIQEIPVFIEPGIASGNMIWSFDGKLLTATGYVNDTEIHIYSIHPDTFTTNLILSLDGLGQPVQWLSATEMLYSLEGDYFVWDSVAQQSYSYQLRPQLPANWESDIYFSELSPDRGQAARYYSVNALRSFISAIQEVPPPDDLSPEYVATLEGIPQVPGFDIYTFSDNSFRHIDVAGQLLQSLDWSPSSEYIVVTTDPITSSNDVNGIYVYSLQDEVLKKLDDFPSMSNTEYGGYEPSWSPDSNWLVFNTPEGYIIYNVETEAIINLSSEFDGYYMNLQWAPIMDYSAIQC